MALDTHVAGVLAAVPVSGAHPDLLADVLVQGGQLEHVVTLRVGEHRHVHLHQRAGVSRVMLVRVTHRRRPHLYEVVWLGPALVDPPPPRHEGRLAGEIQVGGRQADGQNVPAAALVSR